MPGSRSGIASPGRLSSSHYTRRSLHRLHRVRRLVLHRDTTLPPFIRVIGWWKCLQAWAALRHDDHCGIHPRDLVVSAGSLRGELWRSKTTGCDKWSSRDPSLSRPWLTCVIQGGYWLDGSFFWTFARRLEIFFFLPRPAERRQLR